MWGPRSSETDSWKMGREKPPHQSLGLKAWIPGASNPASVAGFPDAVDQPQTFALGRLRLQGSVTPSGNYVTLPTCSSTPPRISYQNPLGAVWSGHNHHHIVILTAPESSVLTQDQAWGQPLSGPSSR